jgi:hypothetical protein
MHRIPSSVAWRRSETQPISSVSAGRCRDPRWRGRANLAAEWPPSAKPSTAARTSSAAGAAKQRQEEKNPHHADNHLKNRVVHNTNTSRFGPFGEALGASGLRLSVRPLRDLCPSLGSVPRTSTPPGRVESGRGKRLLCVLGREEPWTLGYGCSSRSWRSS